jgi:hypothetical protein
MQNAGSGVGGEGSAWKAVRQLRRRRTARSTTPSTPPTHTPPTPECAPESRHSRRASTRSEGGTYPVSETHSHGRQHRQLGRLSGFRYSSTADTTAAGSRCLDAGTQYAVRGRRQTRCKAAQAAGGPKQFVVCRMYGHPFSTWQCTNHPQHELAEMCLALDYTAALPPLSRFSPQTDAPSPLLPRSGVVIFSGTEHF